MDGFRFSVEIDVRFRDLDALGHVNNAVYLTYFETARMEFWRHVNDRVDLSGMDMILARAEVDYRSPLVYGDRIEVGVRGVSIRRTSFVLAQSIVHRPSGRLVAEARKVLVHYDYGAGVKKALPEELRQRLLRQDPDLTIEV